MKYNSRTITILVVMMAVLSIIASLCGILTEDGPGQYEYQSIRGETIVIYGQGIYQHMSKEVAIQGIAQDYVTLFIAVPLLLIALYYSGKESLKWRFVLAGTIAYFLVTYTFYLNMAMYNQFFLFYAALMGLSFFALGMDTLSFNTALLPAQFSDYSPTLFAGGFLMVTAVAIGLLWLGIVLPPLIDGSIYPKGVEHYTTLIVQGNDLGLALPLAFVSGYLLIRKSTYGYLMAPIYLVFLSILMTALVAKIIYLGLMGYNIVPVVFIIPCMNIISIGCAYRLLSGLNSRTTIVAFKS